MLALNPALQDGHKIMDAVEIPVARLPYRIVTLKTDANQRILPEEIPRLRELLKSSRLLYGTGMGSAAIARECGVPYIMILEYDLATQMIATAGDANSLVSGWVRRARCAVSYFRDMVPTMRHAHSLHCNGYPVHAASKSYNKNRLLYLDSRMSGDMLMGNDELAARLAARSGRPLRLLYSGRYEAMKGASDAVKVGLACLKRGLNIEMHCYGQGNLKDEMRRLASGTPITVHDAVPYPELVKISRTFDIFVCCHIQSDPSCTYLESFGAGLPIAGYGNRMWTGLCEASNAGYCSSLGAPQKVAASIESMLAPGILETLSWRALEFARGHRFELEFQKRVESINTAARTSETGSSVFA